MVSVEIVYDGPEMTDEEYEAAVREIERKCSEIISDAWYNGRINMEKYREKVKRLQENSA